MSSASTSDADGSFSEGLRMKAFPQASVGQHPERDHGREVEGGDPGHHADRLQQRVDVHAGGHLGVEGALQELGMPQANSTHSRPGPPSPSASDSTLPCSAVMAAATRIWRRSAPPEAEQHRGAPAEWRRGSRCGRLPGDLPRRMSTSAVDASATSAVCTPRAGRRRAPCARRRRVGRAADPVADAAQFVAHVSSLARGDAVRGRRP